MSEIDALRVKLENARVSEADDNDTLARSKVRKALVAVIDHLRASGVETELTAPLSHLYAALEDIAVGRSNPLLERATMADGTSKKLSFKGSQWSMAAAAVSILMNETELGLKSASDMVGRTLGFQRSQLVEYRKNLTKNRLSEDERGNYDSFLKLRREYDNLSAKAFVSDMLVKGKALAE